MSVALSVVIPIFNAENIIKKNVQKIIAKLEENNISYELILCDDGSRDDSKKAIEAEKKVNTKVRCVYNASNQGLGISLRKLFEVAEGENIIYSDCDLPFGEDVFVRLLQESAGFDVVVMSRYMGEEPKVKLLRKIVSRLYYLLCKLLFGLQVKDIGSGAVLFKKNSLEKLSLEAKGFDIHAEIFVKAREKGLKIKEIPGESFWVEGSSFSIMKHGAGIVLGTFKFWVKTVLREKQ